MTTNWKIDPNAPVIKPVSVNEWLESMGFSKSNIQHVVDSQKRDDQEWADFVHQHFIHI